VEIGSRNWLPMTRYFPEIVEAVKANLPARCVLDGEIVVVVGRRLEFEVVHNASTRRQPGDQAVSRDPGHFHRLRHQRNQRPKIQRRQVGKR
jgi:ATP-dependent DNA ligase